MKPGESCSCREWNKAWRGCALLISSGARFRSNYSFVDIDQGIEAHPEKNCAKSVLITYT